MLKGRCNCGEITFEVTGEVRSVSACHCGQCRRQSGGVWHSAVVEHEDFKVTGMPRWYASSDAVRRGFCPSCGSFLFWHRRPDSTISIALGALEKPTGLTLEKHIFTAHKGDYYEIADGVPQREN